MMDCVDSGDKEAEAHTVTSRPPFSKKLYEAFMELPGAINPSWLH